MSSTAAFACSTAAFAAATAAAAAATAATATGSCRRRNLLSNLESLTAGIFYCSDKVKSKLGCSQNKHIHGCEHDSASIVSTVEKCHQ